MDAERIKYLFERYDNRLATKEEAGELWELLEGPAVQGPVTDYFMEGISKEPEIEVRREEWAAMVRWILNSLPDEDTMAPVIGIGAAEKGQDIVVKNKRGWYQWVAVAAVVTTVVVGWWLIVGKKEQPGAPKQVVEQKFKNDIAPATNHAVLVLGDGRKVILDQAQSGALASDGAVQVQRLADGAIVYEGGSTATEVRYHTISNPRGSQVISLVLADGSRVWLDAASSIRYPTAFTGKERKVDVTGQAYFEVARNAAKPFKVIVDEKAEVEVLGTHFNIMAFADEATLSTTLLEGKVKISALDAGQSAVRGREGTKILQPGEQALIAQNLRDIPAPIRVIRDINTDEVMAWKEGRFFFGNTSLQEVMRQLGRWYDVEVVYEGSRPQTLTFSGAIGRMSNISEVLKMLELTGAVEFAVEGRKVIVQQVR